MFGLVNDLGNPQQIVGENDFQTLLRQRRTMLHRFGLRMLNDTYIIENIVQDAFLKLWNFRETITSTEHAERFLMQSVKWACYSYFRNAGSRFHRRMVQLDALENYDDFIVDVQEYNSDFDDVEQKRLDAISDAIAKVCYGREREVMELHFIKGFTHTQIAERYHLSVTTVTMILEKGKLRLKTVLLTAKDRQITSEGYAVTAAFWEKLEQIEGLSADQSVIYQLRTVGKYSFEQIATFLCLPLSSVQLEYVKAFKIAGGQKKKMADPASRYKSRYTVSSRLSA
ncbi:RNA polymerase sigma factor [Mucilaginibacter litoreus]|uniref:RNA polymerase sigma factor n=1 Tax=Mucilaginibacter litoreus TaxID=1048221 RepID=A0ABW3AWI0_9SPHI